MSVLSTFQNSIVAKFALCRRSAMCLILTGLSNLIHTDGFFVGFELIESIALSGSAYPFQISSETPITVFQSRPYAHVSR